MAWSSPRYARQNGGDGIAQFIGIALATLGVVSSKTNASAMATCLRLIVAAVAMDFEIPDSYPDCCYRNKPTYLSRCHRTITAIATVMPRTNIVR
jgi:hypothetical protein